jgi:hypothetical protein
MEFPLLMSVAFASVFIFCGYLLGKSRGYEMGVVIGTSFALDSLIEQGYVKTTLDNEGEIALVKLKDSADE